MCLVMLLFNVAKSLTLSILQDLNKVTCDYFFKVEQSCILSFLGICSE